MSPWQQATPGMRRTSESLDPVEPARIVKLRSDAKIVTLETSC